MAIPTEFDHPPEGHTGILAYDSVNDKWYAVLVDADGHLQLDVLSIADGEIHLYAWDGDSWEKVTIDASGHLQVDVAAAIALSVQQQQYTGSAWVKSNLLWGYNDLFAEVVYDTNASAGTNTLETTAVPSGYVYILTSCMVVNINSVCTRIRKLAWRSGTEYCDFDTSSSPAAGIHQPIACWIPLKEGDTVRGVFYGCVLNDDIYLAVWGYKMKINM